MRTIGRERRSFDAIPSLKSLHPAAAQWIGALIRVASSHPGMTRILDVVERLSERPYRTNFMLLGEPGTGKEGLGRALAHLTCPDGPLIRYDVAGFPEEDALDVLCGTARRAGIAEAADGGTIFIEELSGLGPKVQAALLRLLKSGRCERRGGMRPTADLDAEGDEGPPGKRGRRLDVRVVASSDRNPDVEVAAGRLRHDLYYRLARVALWLPPLRERIEDLGPATIWTGNRVLRAAGLPLELVGAAEIEGLPLADRARAIVLMPEAVRRLEQHTWPGNFRELEVVLERALLLYRTGDTIGEPEVSAALGL